MMRHRTNTAPKLWKLGAIIALLYGSACAPHVDQDGDGVRAEFGDCNDQNPQINPEAPEVCDELDNDCDGGVDEGLNDCLEPDPTLGGEDDSGTMETPGSPTPSSTPCDGDGDGWCLPNDCNDSDSTVHPGATESCGTDGASPQDSNCDGKLPACWGQAKWSMSGWLWAVINALR